MIAAQPAGGSHRPRRRVRAVRQNIDAGELFAIVLKNAVFKLLTLGVYQFWATAHVRRYLASHVQFQGDPVEWTGSGKEMFKGVLAALFFILLPLMVASAVAQYLALHGHPGLGGTLRLAISAAYVSLVPLGLYRARRYRLSRTLWRGIRGTQDGSSWHYLALWWKWGLLLPFTLFLTWPLRSAELTRYKLRNTVFGDCAFRSDASAGALYLPFMIAVTLLLVDFAVVATLAVALGKALIISHDAKALLVVGPILFVGWLAAMAAWAYYRAAEIRHFTATAHWGDLSFRTDIGTLGLIGLGLPNFLLVLCTLGFGRPFAQMRTLRAVTRYLRIIGEQDFDAIAQNQAPIPTSGEGLVAIFDGVDI